MNIHVSNLPTSITQHQIEDLFAAYGRVKNIRLLEDKHTGLPIGSAYVLMDCQEEADQAINGLDGKEYKGHTLIVAAADAADFPTSDFW